MRRCENAVGWTSRSAVSELSAAGCGHAVSCDCGPTAAARPKVEYITQYASSVRQLLAPEVVPQQDSRSNLPIDEVVRLFRFSRSQVASLPIYLFRVSRSFFESRFGADGGWARLSLASRHRLAWRLSRAAGDLFFFFLLLCGVSVM